MVLENHFTEKEMEVLRARADRVASMMHHAQQDELLTTLGVLVRGETYAVMIDAITTVYENTPIIPVPCVPDYVAGIANIRGHIIPVFDLGILLDVPGSARGEGALIAASNDQVTVAFYVDGIGSVESRPSSTLSPVPMDADLVRATYLKGLWPDGRALLDIEAILNDPTLVIDEGAA